MHLDSPSQLTVCAYVLAVALFIKMMFTSSSRTIYFLDRSSTIGTWPQIQHRVFSSSHKLSAE